ncbi:putative polygalacturonase [Medicago truncatula]|uniref:LRR receptor-like kinase family protein n=1 Tax=Medicago truncatula TaxID=3880 RepID=A0A072U7P5_MEDTR|nr:receptor-like protein EIX1 [Medicago truncatula]KEH25161.1 LRR receptor-like kinase family protein [Medicago truncatula]KEH25162.1 LRR receptor-like kinase family protein [Medicago truncatula]KEH25163.1 LRR receptor-like kinase family protein [Medicago truncatula]KEH25164.1 LRR receptor-like kinase family protein [Medicago truncatula]KEH25165.1 LRR receptor-like kinase family protein [Medicago truncatula]
MLHSGFNFLLCVVAILCINLLCVESFYPSKCVETERQALLKFKDALIHSKVNLTSWKGEECCKWEGISCHNLTGYVTSLNLKPFDYTKAVGGKLDYSICELQHLISLNLDNIGLEGKIPKCIGSLGKLIELKLMYNNFFGVIPPSLGNLSNLQTLDLSHNYLTANDLEWLSHLSDLRYLDLSEVNLTLAIDWLSSISKIHTLSELHLFGCGLHQVTPKSISYMNTSISLKSLDLGENSLNSSILPWVSNVGKVLITLDLSFNQFKGSKPLFEITKLASLQHLDLSHNELSGSFPHTIGQLSYLQELFLSSNKFNSVIIETHLSNLSHLRILDVAHNSLSFNLSLDSVPPFKLFALYASSCTLGPKFPVWLKHHGELRVLDISSSGISDSFPKWFWNLSSSLIYLNVSYNKLNGPLPKSIPNMKFSILENSSTINSDRHLSCS